MFTTSPKNVWSSSKAVLEPFFAGIQVSYLFFLSFEIPVLFFGWVGKTVSMKLYHYYRDVIIIIIIVINDNVINHEDNTNENYKNNDDNDNNSDIFIVQLNI